MFKRNKITWKIKHDKKSHNIKWFYYNANIPILKKPSIQLKIIVELKERKGSFKRVFFPTKCVTKLPRWTKLHNNTACDVLQQKIKPSKANPKVEVCYGEKSF